MRDNRSHLGFQSMLAPAELDADAISAAIDLAGFDAATIEIHVGAGGITFTSTDKIEFELTHSDASGSGFVAVEAADVIMPAGQSLGDGGIVKSLVAAHAAASITKIGYIGNKRYLKLNANFGGTHAAATGISASLVQDHARLKAVA